MVGLVLCAPTVWDFPVGYILGVVVGGFIAAWRRDRRARVIETCSDGVAHRAACACGLVRVEVDSEATAAPASRPH